MHIGESNIKLIFGVCNSVRVVQDRKVNSKPEESLRQRMHVRMHRNLTLVKIWLVLNIRIHTHFLNLPQLSYIMYLFMHTGSTPWFPKMHQKFPDNPALPTPPSPLTAPPPPLGQIYFLHNSFFWNYWFPPPPFILDSLNIRILDV